MIGYRSLFLFISLVVVVPPVAEAQESLPVWYSKLIKIKPLITTRGELEKSFSRIMVTREFLANSIKEVLYEDDGGKFDVEYSIGECPADGEIAYAVPGETVLRVTYFPNSKSKISQFNINHMAFIRFTVSHDHVEHYRSQSIGVDFGTKQKGVEYVVLFPSSSSPAISCSRKAGNY